ncbi:DUF58 domain-containing protein [Pseudaestuariivita rosea]|uniref:DUF58 domain-containing protein n=1 Tax=Pseudaestuariivita rosea TaxID=2763263 RepID=UPI001F2302FD|nr:DUF58 domain-containing protein [Pseudaestuariivita rosea]
MLALSFGALCLSVLAVAMGGGLRQGALIVWIALGALVLLDFFLSWRGRVAVEADFPKEMFVGSTGRLVLGAYHSPVGFGVRISWPRGLDGPGESGFEAYGDDGAVARIPMRAVRRGTWTIPHIWLRWPSRLQLLEFTPRVAVDLSIGVVPDIRPVQSGEITTKVKSTLYGVKENRIVGEGSEFNQLLEFVPGMDIRSIDWKRSARYRTLMAKDMQAERNHHVFVALDNGYLMREEIGGLPKIDHAVNAALAVAWAAAVGGDQVGLYAFDARPRVFTPPEPGRLAFARLRSRTAELEYATVESNHTLAMAELNARTPRRSLIVVFSDFVDTTTAELLVENVSVLAKRHVIIFVALRDPDLVKMVNAVPQSVDDVATLVSAGQLQSERQLVMEKLSRLGVTVIDSEPNAVSARLISTYLEIKARELI